MFMGNDGGPITLADLIYEMQLLPFVMEAWSEVDGDPGVPGRLMQFSQVYREAEAAMERLTGKRRRLKRVIDLPSFTDVYAMVGLP